MDYIAIDFETANEDFASLCQVGLAFIENGNIVDTWGTYIDPEDYFSFTFLHGISEETVKGSPSFPDCIDIIYAKILGHKVVSYGGFDVTAFRQAHEKYSITPQNVFWLNAHKIVRRHWTQFARVGYALDNMCQYLNIDNQNHHDAVNDATVCAKIVNTAILESGKNFDWWVERVNKPIFEVKQEASLDGILYGERVLFTGEISISRGEAAKLAFRVGAEVVESFSKKVTILVVGNQDIKKTKGHTLSSKHRKTLEYIEKGCKIDIIKEDDFMALINMQ